MATKVQGLDQRNEKISDLEVQLNLLNEKAHQRGEKISDVEVKIKLLTEKAQREGENAKQLENQARARNVKYKVFLVIISVAAMGLFVYLIHKLTKKSLSPDTLDSSMSSTFTATKIRITTESDKSIVTWNPDLIPPDS